MQADICAFSVGATILRSRTPSNDQLDLAAMLGWAKADAPLNSMRNLAVVALEGACCCRLLLAVYVLWLLWLLMFYQYNVRSPMSDAAL